MKKIIIAIIAVVSIGLVSQVVEQSINEEAVKEVVTTHLGETPADEK